MTTLGAGESKQRMRQRVIVERVVAEGSVRIEVLAAQFGTSIMTVHRDLDELESLGLLRKIRGGASALSTSIAESSDVYRLAQNSAEKAAIARAAIGLIEPGQAVLMDDSTTVLQMGALLETVVPVTVISNSLPLINAVVGVRGVSLVSLGGSYFNWASAFMGGATVDAISKIRADWCFLSTAAVTDGTCFHQSEDSVATKVAMFESSRQRALLVDHTKFRRQALHAAFPVSDFDCVILDWRLPKQDRADIEAFARKVVVARPPR